VPTRKPAGENPYNYGPLTQAKLGQSAKAGPWRPTPLQYKGVRRNFFHFVVPDYVGPYGADDSVAQAPYATRVAFARLAALGVSAGVILAMGAAIFLPFWPWEVFAGSVLALGLAYAARRVLVERPGEDLAAGVTCGLAFAVTALGFALQPSVGLGIAGAATGHLVYTALVRRDFSFIGLGISGAAFGSLASLITLENRWGAAAAGIAWGVGFCALLPLVMRRRRSDQLVMALADLPSEPLAVIVQAGRILKIMARYSRRSRPQ
jgi:hypothetical protein